MPLNPLKSCLREALEALEANSIRYCILRNYEFLLAEGNACSLDTIVAESDIKAFEKVLFRFGFCKRTQQFSLKHKAYFKLVNGRKVSFDVQVGGVHWNDMRYIGEEILDSRVKKRFFYTPSDNYAFIMLLAHSILGKRFFKKKYQQILLSTDVDEDFVLGKLSEIFRQKIAQRLFSSVRDNKFETIPIYPYLLYFILKEPRRPAVLSALFIRWLKWKRPFMPAPIISVLGPDGSGKSTLVSKLEQFLTESKKETAVVYSGRGRNHILPITTLGRKYKSSEKKKDMALKIKKNTLRRKLLYTFAAPVFALDLFIRNVFTIFPKRMRKKIVITDRYCSDIVLMKHVPLQLKKLLYKLFPRPTISIFLYNDPEILHGRRPEEPVGELRRQLEIFKKFDYSISIKTTDEKKDFEKARDFVAASLLKNWH